MDGPFICTPKKPEDAEIAADIEAFINAKWAADPELRRSFWENFQREFVKAIFEGEA